MLSVKCPLSSIKEKRFMRRTISILIAVLVVLGVPRAGSTQTTTSTISGHVTDSQGLAVPGATITVTSANLQGARTVVSSENGDFIVAQLPAGTYEVVFELTGFERVVKTAMLAPTVRLTVDATL